MPPKNNSIDYMPGAENVSINGGAVLQVGGAVMAPVIINTGTDTTDRGFKALYGRVASGAFFNSSERGDPPTCYPETRTAILQRIMDWLHHYDTDNIHSDQLSSTSPENFTSLGNCESEIDFDFNKPAIWLHGPAGSGKTAIAQKIAEMCYEMGCLSAAFFFSRTAFSNEAFLVPTLAYEISKHVADVKPFISAAILNDPFIFDLSIESQINSLIITPLKQVAFTMPSGPRLIIIDGLDECLNRDAQSNIIHFFTAALSRFPDHAPHKLLIASRREHQLDAAFAKENQYISHLPLRETLQAYDDVRHFIQKSFDEVKEKHYLRNRIPDLWPSDDDVSKLVSKSSGHFIYASTVVKYVTSARHNPAERLNVILGLNIDVNNKPYADLDALYSHILSKMEDVETVRLIFRILLAKTLSRLGSPNAFTLPDGDRFKAAEYLLRLPEGKGDLKLLDLFEVLIAATKQPEARKIKFLHASFTDYLVDPSRSGKFCINDDNLCLTLVKECVALTTAKQNLDDAIDHSHHLRLCYDMLVHLSESIPKDSHRCPQLYKLLSQMDWNTALSQLTSMRYDNPEVLGSVTRFISWVVERYTSTTSDNANILEDFISNLRSWFFAQLKMFPFNGPDNSARVDLTVFAMVPLLYERDANILRPLKDIFRNVDWNGNLIQASFTPDVVLCWRMMQKLPCFFENANIALSYTVTEKRYTNAARYCLSYLLPETPSWTRKWRQSQTTTPSGESYERAMECLAFMLPKSSAHFQMFSICKESMKNAVGNSDYDAINEHILQGNVDPLTALIDKHLDKEMEKANTLLTPKPLLLSWEIARYLVRCGQNHDILNPPISQNWLFLRAIPTSKTLARRHAAARHKKSMGYN